MPFLYLINQSYLEASEVIYKDPSEIFFNWDGSQPIYEKKM